MNPNTARTMRAKFQVAGVEQVEHDGTVTAAAEQPGEATTPQNPMAESIRGYRQFDAGTANYINAVKETGDVVAQMLQDARDLGADPRALALAQTKFQEAAMWLIRSVAKPEGLF